MKLIDLMKRANAGYPDEYLGQYFQYKTGEPVEGTGDTLAEFIVRELAETFDPDASDEDQIDQAVKVLEEATSDLNGVMAALRGQPMNP
jgi:hypothetical protein